MAEQLCGPLLPVAVRLSLLRTVLGPNCDNKASNLTDSTTFQSSAYRQRSRASHAACSTCSNFAMSLLPPDTIQVKRKRGAEDGPVDFLRSLRPILLPPPHSSAHLLPAPPLTIWPLTEVETTSKRLRSIGSLPSDDAAWVYQRKTADAQQAGGARPSGPPIIRPTKEGDKVRRPRQEPIGPASKNDFGVSLAALNNKADGLLRRFHHLSRPDSSQHLPTLTSRKRGAPAVFVERSAKKQKEFPEPEISHPQGPDTTAHDASAKSLAVRPSTPTHDDAMATAAQQPGQMKYKRPGTKLRPSNAPTAAKPSLPPSLLNRGGINMDELARDMEAYTLNQITMNLDRMDRSSSKAATSPDSARKSRFKPKAPAKRFAERHPDYVAERERAKAAIAQQQTDVSTNDQGNSTDEDDYVLETYERVPASRLRDQAVPPHRVGLLVFDTEPERIDFFYGNEEESDDDFLEDEDDENGELSTPHISSNQ